ncbi:MAG: hypothetical protein MUE55_05255 [Thermoplasmata archaeon]|nr:hypothetical protein [Thermoplasmata archaeon]
MSELGAILQPLIDWLQDNQLDPWTYVAVFYAYCVAAAVILPIPVEIFLFGDPVVSIYVKALIMGLGKGTGALAVFFIGFKVEQVIMKYAHWGWFKWMLDKSEVVVRKYGYPAMFAIMCIPFFPDTVTLYVFSILNKEGKLMTWHGLVITNVLAGIARAFIVYFLFRDFFEPETTV